MGLLLHSLGLPRPVFFLWDHLLFCGLWTIIPAALPFWPNGLYIAAFFLHSFHIIGLLLPLDPLVKKWASTPINEFFNKFILIFLVLRLILIDMY